MKKISLAERLARKAFKIDAVQKSWQIDLQTFGPILEPAFVDNYKAKLHLTAALNYISKEKPGKGLEKLWRLKKECATDEDITALLFCLGLGFEKAGMKENMVSCYLEAGEYKHKFYYPYLRVAKSAYQDGVYEVAEENYKKAIQCLEEETLDDQKRTILGVSYSNYASCLTMMHRYEDAEEAMKKSIEILPEYKGRTVTEAILQAAMGNAEKALACTEATASEMPEFYEHTKKMVNEILEKRHPHFFAVELSEDALDAFWDWFLQKEESMRKQMEQNEYEAVLELIQPKLKELFPFAERDLDFGIEPKAGFYQISFADFFMVSLEYGYGKLIERAPKSLEEHWGFEVAR